MEEMNEIVSSGKLLVSLVDSLVYSLVVQMMVNSRGVVLVLFFQRTMTCNKAHTATERSQMTKGKLNCNATQAQTELKKHMHKERRPDIKQFQVFIEG